MPPPEDAASQYSDSQFSRLTGRTGRTGVSAAPAGVHRISQKSMGRTLMWLAGVGVIAFGLIVLVLAAPWSHKSPLPPGPSGTDQTSITRSLNDQIKEGTGLYTGGKGILVRTPDNLDASDNAVVPATFWVNDIKTPSQLYPSGNPWCPHGKSDGYEDLSWSKCNQPNGPWDFATVAVVVGVDGMKKIMTHFDDIQNKDWGWGVFYATDSNSADSRCHWKDSSAAIGNSSATSGKNASNDGSGWDCPGFWVNPDGTFNADGSMKGAGFYSQGNPAAKLGGGGAGCHFERGQHEIDQVDAFVGKDNLVQDAHCQCNYHFNQDWTAWVQDWIDNNKQKSGFEWRKWLNGGGKAPSWGVDSAICWVNNPRDMIAMQNAIYAKRDKWNNGMAPLTDGSDRHYWGWNEVPVTRNLISDPLNWDAVMIKLPAQLCGGQQDHLGCLGRSQQEQLEEDLDAMVRTNKLLLGKHHIVTRPGSYMVVVREFETREGDYQRQFYCENWVSPNNKYQLVFQADKAGHDAQEPGVCFLDQGSSIDKGNSTLRLIV